MDPPTPELAVKHRGITVELQVGSGHLYFNPFEEFSDRTPRNADVIVSAVSPGDVTGRGETHAFLSGFACYGTPQTVYFVGDQLAAQWAAERAQAAAVAYTVPGTGAGVHRLRLGGQATVGGHAVRVAPVTMVRDDRDRRRLVGMEVAIAGRRFTYLQLAPAHLEALAHQRSDVLVLVPDHWAHCLAPLAAFIRTHPANHFVLVHAGARTRDHAALLRELPPAVAAKVVVKKSKWRVPPLAGPSRS